MEPFIGEIRLLPYTFAPKGWALCDGQLLAIRSNTALFSIIGVNYGGDGKVTFALPNLQGCVVPGAGQGPGLQNWDPGMRAGSETVTLTQAEMPRHIHRISGLDVTGTSGTPSADVYLGQDKRGGHGNINYLVPSETVPDVTLASEAMSSSGGGQPHENRQPFISVNFCIAMEGIFPTRN